MRFGKPAAISVLAGSAIPLLGYTAVGAPASAADILALIVVIPLWGVAIRAVIFAGQWLNR